MPGVSAAGFKSPTKRNAEGNIQLMRLLLSIFAWLFVIGVVCLLFIALLGSPCQGAKLPRIAADFNAIGAVLKSYNNQNGSFPSTEEGFSVLIHQQPDQADSGRWKQYLRSIPKDPWGNEYRYRRLVDDDRAEYELRSAGKDGKPGTKDDLSSLDE